jgi:hypothetical protein
MRMIQIMQMILKIKKHKDLNHLINVIINNTIFIIMLIIKTINLIDHLDLKIIKRIHKVMNLKRVSINKITTQIMRVAVIVIL